MSVVYQCTWLYLHCLNINHPKQRLMSSSWSPSVNQSKGQTVVNEHVDVQRKGKRVYKSNDLRLLLLLLLLVGGKQVDPKATFIFGWVLSLHAAHQSGQQVQLLLGQKVWTVIRLQENTESLDFFFFKMIFFFKLSELINTLKIFFPSSSLFWNGSKGQQRGVLAFTEGFLDVCVSTGCSVLNLEIDRKHTWGSFHHPRLRVDWVCRCIVKRYMLVPSLVTLSPRRSKDPSLVGLV